MKTIITILLLLTTITSSYADLRRNDGGDIPVGTTLDYAGANCPAGFLKMDASAYSRTLYPKLFTVIGTNYGVGDGSTTFNLPLADFGWTSYGTIILAADTTVPTKGTIVIDKLSVKKIGDSAILYFQFEQSSAGTAGSGNYYLQTPNSLIIDQAKYFNGSNNVTASVGHGMVSTSADFKTVEVSATGTQRFTMIYLLGASSVATVNSTSHPFSNANLRFSVTITVPIVGWKAISGNCIKY